MIELTKKQHRSWGFRHVLLASAAYTSGVFVSGVALAQDGETKVYSIPPSDVGAALQAYSEQADVEIIYTEQTVNGKSTDGVSGVYSRKAALEEIIEDTDLIYEVNQDGVVVIRSSFLDVGRVVQESSIRVAQVASSRGQEGESINRYTDKRDEREGQEQRDVIIVTGTNIRGAQTSASPVFVFDREDIALVGAATAQEFLRAVPQNLNFSENAAAGGAGPVVGLGGSSAGVNIRGLGAGATLTLVNGRRLAQGGAIGNFVDISSIPLAAIDRVEVLTDGASAIYGADAIAGVVNFILRDDYDGAETRLRFGGVTEGGSQQYQVSQTVGRAWGGGGVLAYYEYYRRNNLDANDRSFSEDALDPTDLLPRQERHNAYLSARQSVSNQVILFGSGNFSASDTENRATQFSFVESNTSRDVTVKQYGGDIGVKFDVTPDWQIQLVGAHNRNDTEVVPGVGATDSFISVESNFQLWTVDLIADGPIFQLPGGEVRLAVGGQFRNEQYDRSQNTTFFVRDISLKRDVYAFFGEISLPIVGEDNQRLAIHALELTAAGRFEDFSDAGSTANPKVGLRYEPIEGLNLRATFGTSFQAPSFFDLGTAQSASAIPGAFFAVPPGSPSAPNTIIRSGGNPDLGPENGRTWTVGMDYSPSFASGLDLKLTYFDVNFEDRIGAPLVGSFLSIYQQTEALEDVLFLNPEPTLINDLFAGTEFLNFFNLTADQIGAVFDGRETNIASTKVRGLDFTLDYSAETSLGVLSYGLNGSYLIDFIDQSTPTSPPTSRLNTLFEPVDLRFRASAAWSKNGFNAAAFINYVDDYTSNVTGAEVPVGAWTTVDLNFSYDTGFDSRLSWFNQTVFRLSVQNLFDEDPPFVDNGLGAELNFDGVNANALGRFIAFQIQKSF